MKNYQIIKLFLNRSFVLILLGLCTLNVNAHTNTSTYNATENGSDTANKKTSSISANAHFLFANKGTVMPNQPWQIPGAFMGGEAYPVEKGLNLKNFELKALGLSNLNTLFLNILLMQKLPHITMAK